MGTLAIEGTAPPNIRIPCRDCPHGWAKWHDDMYAAVALLDGQGYDGTYIVTTGVCPGDECWRWLRYQAERVELSLVGRGRV